MVVDVGVDVSVDVDLDVVLDVNADVVVCLCELVQAHDSDYDSVYD